MWGYYPTCINPEISSVLWEAHIHTYPCTYASIHTRPRTIYGPMYGMSRTDMQAHSTHKLNQAHMHAALQFHFHMHTHSYAACLCQTDVRKMSKVGSRQRAAYPLELIHFTAPPPSLFLATDLCLHLHLMSSLSVCFYISPSSFLSYLSPLSPFFLSSRPL